MFGLTKKILINRNNITIYILIKYTLKMYVVTALIFLFTSLFYGASFYSFPILCPPGPTPPAVTDS